MGEKEIVLDGSKILWHQDRVNAWLKGERIAPITIDCSISTKCSYRCIYCYGQLQCMHVGVNLDRDTIMNFLDDAAEIGVKAVSFVSDGESTCNPHLKEAILRGKSNGLDMALGTNGYLLQDNDLEDILPCLTYLRFNISAGEPERYAYIHGCDKKCYYKVLETIRKAVGIKKNKNLDVTIGLQMVLMPEFADQVLPLAKLGYELDVDYLVIKHCSDDETGTLGVNYDKYNDLVSLLKDAEAYSTNTYRVQAKWSKILSNGIKGYDKCYGPPFIIQFSGTGLVAPCGMFFNDKYKAYHIGNIAEMRFRDIWKSDRYWEVMAKISSDAFNPQTECGTLCLQHKTNEVLWRIKHGETNIANTGNPPMHVNFI